MPLVDMPLDKLRNYQGINPRPTDFDAFWERGLAEQQATDPDVKLEPAPFQKSTVAECFDLYFTGVGGARIHCKYLRPKRAQGKCPAMLLFHGYSGNAGDWHDKLSWVSQGYCVAAMDCRGQGGYSEDIGGVKGTTLRGSIIRGLDDAPEKLLFRQVYLDCAQMARVVMDFPEVDRGRVGAFGGSQGGALTLVCSALVPGIRRCAPVYPFLSDYRRTWEMDLFKDAYEELKYYFRCFDPRHEREDEIFMKLGYIDIQFLAPRIRATVMMGTGLMDTICPPSTQFAAYNKITAPKTVVIYPDFGHEGLPGFSDKVFDFMADL